MQANAMLTLLEDFLPQAVAIRHHLHAHPELSCKETDTAAYIAAKLEEWGYEVSRHIGDTGIVASLHNGKGKTVAFRAELDALPILEENTFGYCSQNKGVMHACGHDGHMSILIASAWYLAQTKHFNGTVRFIFQPAEEDGQGAARMIADGLFERFPCDAIYALHNQPGVDAGQFGLCKGPFMASASEVSVRIHGREGHGAVPELTIDPTIVCATIILALQTIVSRNISPMKSAVISVGKIEAGTASNIIPAYADMLLTVRALDPDIGRLLEHRIREVITQQAASFGAAAEMTYRTDYPALVNHDATTRMAEEVIIKHFGSECLVGDFSPIMASDDFACMLEKCPGTYISIGNGVTSAALHTAKYDFNDDVLLNGAALWVHLAQTLLQAE